MTVSGGSDKLRRRLTVILSSDVAGYSRLVAENDEDTVRRMALISSLFRRIVSAYQGRVFNTAGDAILAEFPSAVDAVRCALDVHDMTNSENLKAPAGRSLAFRIGIAVGDVIVMENEDLLGDGVNIAARLQSLANPGGICVSNEVWTHVRSKIDVQFIDLGLRELKNIGAPVHAFAIGQGARTPPSDKSWTKWAVAATALVITAGLLAGGARLLLDGKSSQVARGPDAENVPPIRRTASAPTPVAPLTPPSSEHREILGEEALRSRLITALPLAPGAIRDKRVGSYVGEPLHRAFFKSPDQTSTYRVAGYASAQQAEEVGFERCQIYYAGACELLAVDNEFVDWPGQRREMPRVQYAGVYDPIQIPGIHDELRARADIASYGLAEGPKAIAIHNWGTVYVSTHANDQQVAEEKALDECNDDPSRKGRDGSCLLYAVGNQVVLPERHTDPTDAEAAYQRIIAALSRSTPGLAATQRVMDYAHQSEPKALATHIELGKTFWSSGLYDENRPVAETLALEGCQQTYGSPCVLLAVGTELRATDPVSAPSRDMPRLHYTGSFQPEEVPFVTIGNAADLVAYPSLPGSKAIAIRAWHTRFSIASGAPSIADAERKALAACNEVDPNPSYPCFVYASGDRVVLPERRTEASP